MKKYILFSFIALLSVSCNAGKESMQIRKEEKKAEKIAKIEATAISVESRRFVIRMDRMYAARGGMFYLVPRRNYIIIDDNMAKMSLAYVGRSYDTRGIAGINLKGKTDSYELVKKSDKGQYEIKMSLSQGNSRFDLFLTVSESGQCYLSVVNPRIESIRYSGDLMAIK